MNIKIICAQCGKEKNLRSNYFIKEKNFCSQACSAKYHSKAKAVEIVCEYCGGVRIIPKWYATQGVRFCSRECSSAYRSKQSNTEGMLRRCSVCGEEKRLNEKNWGITIDHGLIKFRHPCRTCANEKARIQRIKHRDNVLARLKEWRQKNKEHCREYKREYAAARPGYNKECYDRQKERPNYRNAKKESDRKYNKSHREHINQMNRKRRRQAWKKLTDGVIKQLYVCSGINREIISPEMIELKRQQIIMKRTLKEFKKWRNKNEPNHTDVYGKQHANEINYERGVSA